MRAGLAPRRPPGLCQVALTVDADDAALDAILEAVPLDMLQLHGQETPERVAEVRARYGLPVMKAVGVADEEDLPALPDYAAVADQILIDAKPPEGRRAARRQRPRLRLAADGRAALAAALDAGRRADGRERGRGDPADRRAAGRRLLGRGKRAGRQGPRPDRGLRRGGAGRRRVPGLRWIGSGPGRAARDQEGPQALRRRAHIAR